MPKSGIPLGRFFGIPVRLHYSWFIVFLLVTWALSANYFPATYPAWGVSLSVAAGVATSILFFASLLAHELMHSLVARAAGIQIHSITLFIFGGVSQMTEEPKQPKDELRIALAGPLTSLAISAVFWALRYVFAGSSQVVVGISFWLGWINMFLALFNLIPGFPLDGGRVLRSVLWWRSKDLRKATRTASNIGRGVGYLFIFAGIWMIFRGSLWNGLWLAFIGWFLENAAVGSYRQLALRDMLRGHTVREVMTRDCAVVPPQLPIDQLVHEHILTSGRRCFPVVENGRVLGLVTIHSIRAVPRDLWGTKTVGEAMTPYDDLKLVRPEEDLSAVLQTMTEGDVNQLPVIDDNSRIVGVIGRDSLLSYISVRGELGM